jgi:chemotaxis receptor (MCP) glutamine deamidase CheD
VNVAFFVFGGTSFLFFLVKKLLGSRNVRLIGRVKKKLCFPVLISELFQAFLICDYNDEKTKRGLMFCPVF